MIMKGTTSPYIALNKSKIHSKGVFAKKRIAKGMRIIEYVGEKITKAESDKRADIPLEENEKDDNQGAVYIFQLNKRYDIDGYVPYNTARFINHSCDPNCETDVIQGRIWIIATCDIERGEEITYNYNYSWDDYEDHECYCRTDKCVGYILAEEHWPRLKHKKRKITAKRK